MILRGGVALRVFSYCALYASGLYFGVVDTIYPVEISQRLARVIPNSLLVTIPGAAAVFEAPKQFKPVYALSSQSWTNSG